MKAYIIGVSLAACIILYIIEQVLAVDYITKTIAKLILFTVIPWIYLKFVKKSSIKDILSNRRIEPSTFKLGLIFGAWSFLVIKIGRASCRERV